MEKTWLLAETVLLTPVAQESVLLNTQTGDRYVLNPLATAICALFQSGSTISEAIGTTQAYFPTDSERVERDIQEFIAQLQSEGLIVEKI